VELEFHYMSRMSSQNGTQSIDRAARLLVQVLESDDPVSVGDLAQAAGLPKSTASRLLRALELQGLVQRDGARGSLRPGPVMFRFGRRVATGADLVALADDILDRLAETTGETINLAIPGLTGIEHLAQRESRHFLGSTNWVGRRIPYHCAANGKVFLAFGAARLPRGELERFTPQTITDPERLEEELAQVRARGYASAFEELEPGLVAVAAPVYGADGDVLAAVSVSAPTIRLSAARIDDFGTLLMEHGAELSARLGYNDAKRGAA
jgi:IclR family transcriptional regulator, acetate operon repressor